jgi:hypothetical protein
MVQVKKPNLTVPSVHYSENKQYHSLDFPGKQSTLPLCPESNLIGTTQLEQLFSYVLRKRAWGQYRGLAFSNSVHAKRLAHSCEPCAQWVSL